MATNNKRLPATTEEDDFNPNNDSPMSRPVKQIKLEKSLDIYESHKIPTDSNQLFEDNRRPSLADVPGDAENAAVLTHLKAKIIDFEAKLSQMQNPAAGEHVPFLNGDTQFDIFVAPHPPKEPLAKREPARPMLNRIPWLNFKNFYPNEAVFAIDVLIGPPKFYWQRRAEEREMRDRMEAAKSYDVQDNEKAQEKAKEKAATKTAMINSGVTPSGAMEMPERIRINSRPILAILADIMGERWGTEPKVMLRPYKLLVAFEAEIRGRLEVLKRLWAKRERPEDVTTSAGAVDIIYEPETLDDDQSGFDTSLYRGLTSDTASSLSHERQSRWREDLTTTYDALQDLTCLIEFMDQDLFPIVRRYGRDSLYPKVYFRDLWYLYRPGDWVVLDERRGTRFSPDAGPQDERPPSQPGKLGERAATIWRVFRTADGRPKLSPPNKDERNRPPSSEVNPFCVRCYRIDYDGDRFGPIWVDFDFQPWVGEKSIAQLDIVPLRLTKDATEKKDRSIARGKRFMELREPQHRIYSGPLLNFHPSGLLFEHVSPGQRDVYGSVIVDFKETARMNPKMVMKLGFSDARLWDEDLTTTEDYPLYVWEDRKIGRWRETVDEIYEDSYIDEHLKHQHIRRDPFLSRYDNLLQGDFIDGNSFEDDEFALLPNRVCAYILQRRQFAILKLDFLRPQGPDAQNWDDLFLARDNKETVKAQTLSHFRNKRLRAINPDLEFDLSLEKGLGLIILLHGVPGVGKTSTAECVAQLLGKPLFPITCGDLGTSAEQVEQQLYEIFGKAEKWDCVLLLDEADVFLASRGKNDLKRNAVVSVFLRILELYTGILFLTTNRIGVLDEAFMSRIHTQLYYPPLEEDQSIKIWKTNLRKLQRRKLDTMQMDVDQILHFARGHFEANMNKSTRWNGRQIRNACQAAAALAEYEAFGMNDGISRRSPDPSARFLQQPVAILEVRHFQRVDHAMREFHDYMKNVCGEDFAGAARMKNERDDDFEPHSKRTQDHLGGHSPMPRPAHSPDEASFPPYGGSGGYSTGRGGQFNNPHEGHYQRHRWSSFSRDEERPHLRRWDQG